MKVLLKGSSVFARALDAALNGFTVYTCCFLRVLGLLFGGTRG